MKKGTVTVKDVSKEDKKVTLPNLNFSHYKARFKGGPVVTKSPLVTGSCPDSFLKHWQTTQLTWECKTPARHNG